MDLLALINDNGIFQEIAHIDSLASSGYSWVFSAQQPANVSKEKPTSGIVRVGIRFTEFVMDSVVSTPFVNMILNHLF